MSEYLLVDTVYVLILFFQFWKIYIVEDLLSKFYINVNLIEIVKSDKFNLVKIIFMKDENIITISNIRIFLISF